LYRSRDNCKIGGVCEGLGEYFKIDPTFIRIFFVLLIFADGIGLLAYIIAWIVGETVKAEEKKPEKVEYSPWNRYIPGAILIILGLFFIVREHYWWWHIERFWPLLLIGFGIFLILKLGHRHNKLEGTNESSQV
jgi:phage shock protein PspC (stress-responsive transcriptional regulator)